MRCFCVVGAVLEERLDWIGRSDWARTTFIKLKASLNRAMRVP